MAMFLIATLAEKHELARIVAPTHSAAAWRYSQRLIGESGEAYRETGAPHTDGNFRLWKAGDDPLADKKSWGLVTVSKVTP